MTHDEYVKKVQREAYVPPVSRPYRPRVDAVADADAFIAAMKAKERAKARRAA